MTRKVLFRMLGAGILIGVGWGIGRAQMPQADFEIRVNAPGGETTVECVRGCGLAWVERDPNPRGPAPVTFKYACSSARCSSGRVGGWLQR